VLATVLGDDRCAVLSRDVDQTAASVAAFSPGDGAAWQRMVADWERIQPRVLQAVFRPFPPARPLTGLLHDLGLGDSLRLVRQALLPARRLGDERFAGAGAPSLLAGCALHADLPPDGAGSGLYGWLLAMLGQSHGFPVPVGGAGRLADALAARLRARGGSIRVSAPVDRVLVRDATATGVRLASGEQITARRAVLADVAAPLLYQQLIGPDLLPERFVADLADFEWDTPTLKVDWALSSPIPWTAPGARTAGTVHVGADLDRLTVYAGELARRRVPTDPFLLLGQMITTDPTRSPDGTESAWGYTHLPIDVTLSAEQIDRHVALVEATVERHAPGFGSLILARRVQSPAQLQGTEPNLVHGAINGGTAQLHQQLVLRPTPGLGGAITPIDRLYLAGSSAHPGGGVHGGPGANAAHAAVARSGALGVLTHPATRALLTRINGPRPR